MEDVNWVATLVPGLATLIGIVLGTETAIYFSRKKHKRESREEIEEYLRSIQNSLKKRNFNGTQSCQERTCLDESN